MCRSSSLCVCSVTLLAATVSKPGKGDERKRIWEQMERGDVMNPEWILYALASSFVAIGSVCVAAVCIRALFSPIQKLSASTITHHTVITIFHFTLIMSSCVPSGLCCSAGVAKYEIPSRCKILVGSILIINLLIPRVADDRS